MFIIYDLIFLLFALIYFPYVIAQKKIHKDFKMRLGIFSKDLIDKLSGTKNIWIHAVSVGEVLAVCSLIDSIKNKYPDCNIVCSTVTKTGNDLAKARLNDKAEVIYAPLDFSWIVKKFIKVINPKIYIIAETELWPNVLLALKKKKIPIVLINGRISDEAYEGYSKFRFLTSRFIRYINLFCVQSPQDRNRIISLGADENKVEIIGNIKFDSYVEYQDIKKEEFGYKPEDIILVAASTHEGEEEILISIYRKLVLEFTDLRLVIVPRHVERSEKIKQMIKDVALIPVSFSSLRDKNLYCLHVLVVDQIGHLNKFYAISKLSFVGKSLIGKGGQNIIEPASLGKAIFVGPNTSNFSDVINVFKENNALVEVKNKTELYKKLKEFLGNRSMIESLELSSRRVVTQNQGVAAKTLSLIDKLFSEIK